MPENTLKNWSYKKLKMWRNCPFSLYLKYMEHVAEPPQDPKYDAKRLRGINAHDDLEKSVNHGQPVPREFSEWQPIVDDYRAINAIAEGDEFFDENWQLIPKEKVQYSEKGYPFGYWLIVKKDVVARTPEYSLVADWKTGRKHGNEYDHFEQMVLYGVTEYVLNPGLPEYAVELQYLDQKDTWEHSFKPPELETHWHRLDREVGMMFSDTLLRPTPSNLACRYCPYNLRNGTGACPVAVV